MWCLSYSTPPNHYLSRASSSFPVQICFFRLCIWLRVCIYICTCTGRCWPFGCTSRTLFHSPLACPSNGDSLSMTDGIVVLVVCVCVCACARVQDRFISTYISVGGESLHPLALALSFFVVFPLAKSCPFSSSEGCGRCDQPALDCALFWIECRRCWVIVFEFSSGSLLVVVSSPCCCAVPPLLHSLHFLFSLFVSLCVHQS